MTRIFDFQPGAQTPKQPFGLSTNSPDMAPWHELFIGRIPATDPFFALSQNGLYEQAIRYEKVYRIHDRRKVDSSERGYEARLDVIQAWLRDRGYRLFSEDRNRQDALYRKGQCTRITQYFVHDEGIALLMIFDDTEDPSCHRMLATLGTTNTEHYEQFRDLVAEWRMCPPTKGILKMVVQNGPAASLDLQSVSQKLDEPFLECNYNQDVVEAYHDIHRNLTHKKPRGRLSIFNGPAGTGKSFLFRAFISSIRDACFLLLSPKHVDLVADPTFVSLLMGERRRHTYPIVLLLEDADHALAVRSSSNISTISSLLNLADGLYGDALDIRVLCTTNQSKDEIDPAVMRPGRLCRHVEVGPLTHERAIAAFARLCPGKETPETLNKGATLAQVYALAAEHGWSADTSTPTPVGEDFQELGSITYGPME